MIINLTYIFFILIGIYFGIFTYIKTRKRQIFPVIAIFVFSFFLEIDWLNTASYKLDLNDFLRTTRDIVRTVAILLFFQCMREHFPYLGKKHVNPKKHPQRKKR